MRITRIQFELSEDRNKELEALMEKTGTRTKKDLFNNALTLLEWAVKEKRTGRIIASVDERGKKYKEIVMPVLENVPADEREPAVETA